MVGKAGEGAYSLALIHFFWPYFQMTVYAIIWVGIFWIIGKTAQRIVGNVSMYNDIERICKRGADFTSEQQSKVLDTLREHY